MEEQVRFLTEQVQALQAELQHQRQQLQQGVGALPQLAASVEMLARRAARPTGLIDNRGVGKPPTFTNKEDDLLAWSRKTENYVASGLGEEFRGVLRWAQELEEEPTREALERAFGPAAQRPQDLAQLQEWSHQLYAVLLSFTSGESNDLVVGSGEGLRAWRRLARRWDPHTSTTTSKLLRAIVASGRAGFADLNQCMERWQQLVARYEQRRDRNGVRAAISDEIKRAALEQPGARRRGEPPAPEPAQAGHLRRGLERGEAHPRGTYGSHDPSSSPEGSAGAPWRRHRGRPDGRRLGPEGERPWARQRQGPGQRETELERQVLREFVARQGRSSSWLYQ